MNWNPLTWFKTPVVDSVEGLEAETLDVVAKVHSLQSRATVLSENLTAELTDISQNRVKTLQNLEESYKRSVVRTNTVFDEQSSTVNNKLSSLTQTLTVIEKVVSNLS